MKMLSKLLKKFRLFLLHQADIFYNRREVAQLTRNQCKFLLIHLNFNLFEKQRVMKMSFFFDSDEIEAGSNGFHCTHVCTYHTRMIHYTMCHSNVRSTYMCTVKSITPSLYFITIQKRKIFS